MSNLPLRCRNSSPNYDRTSAMLTSTKMLEPLYYVQSCYLYYIILYYIILLYDRDSIACVPSCILIVFHYIILLHINYIILY